MSKHLPLAIDVCNAQIFTGLQNSGLFGIHACIRAVPNRPHIFDETAAELLHDAMVCFWELVERVARFRFEQVVGLLDKLVRFLCSYVIATPVLAQVIACLSLQLHPCLRFCGPQPISCTACTS